MILLDICCFKWKSPPGYRSNFGPQAVNVLASMVARNYQKPHRFTCITDDANGISQHIRIIPLWMDHSNISSPHGNRNPSCYRRLKLFSTEAKDLIGPRIVALDLDVVITGDMIPVWDRPDDFIIWKNASPPTPYNGSMFLLKAGSRSQVWDQFHPVKSPQKTRAANIFGSDQAWISYILGKGEKMWDESDGIYSYRVHMGLKNNYKLPENAKMVVFHGADDPWGHNAQRHKWVRENWR